MGFNEDEYHNLIRRAERYKETLENTERYRKMWLEGLKQEIKDFLKKFTEMIALTCSIEERDDVVNLEAVVLNLGSKESGLDEEVENKIRRSLIKNNGSLVYQQLFNGKVVVLINFPFIEKYGQQPPPKTIAIYRPEELKEPFFIRHLETFLTELTNWEDYDDDFPNENQRIGFKLNFEQVTPS